MKVFFIRHGRTNYNELDLCNDDKTKDVYLTALGIKQAKDAARKLKDKKFELIFVSELPRTRQTADIINRYHSVQINIDKRINDRKTGFEGRPASEYYKAIETDVTNFKINNGESLKEEKKRVLSFLRYLKKLKYSSVLIVTHKETIQIINGYFNKLSDEKIIKTEVKNAQILEFKM